MISERVDAFMSITMSDDGRFVHTENFLKRITRKGYYKKVDRLAKEGVQALSKATPKRTGLTAASWDYEIITTNDDTTISWTNSNYIDGWYYGADGKLSLVTLLVYGHANPDGSFVPPNDFVTPTINPILDDIVNGVWKGATSK